MRAPKKIVLLDEALSLVDIESASQIYDHVLRCCRKVVSVVHQIPIAYMHEKIVQF